MNENNLWEENDLTEQSPKFENNVIIARKDTINETKMNFAKRECKYIGRIGTVY